MKLRSIIPISILAVGAVSAQDTCHFNKTEIPHNEVRLLELSRVVEFRCKCVLPKSLIDRIYKGDVFMQDTQFLAERYQAGKCVSRKFFSLGKYSPKELTEGSYRSIISFGWKMDDQKLVGVNDTGFFRLPGFVDLPDFSVSRPAFSFFESSEAESRTCARGSKFNLYPIIGICGDEQKTYNGLTLRSARIDISKFTSSELAKHYRGKEDSVIVYLYFGTGTRDLDYDKLKAEQDGAVQPATAPKSKPEGNEEPKPESKARPQ